MSESESNAMKIGLLFMKICLVLAMAGGTGWYFSSPKSAKDDKKVETKKVNVERGDLVLNVTATGEIKPVKEVELKSKASGLMVRFKKLPSEPVKEGELLCELDKKVEQ